MSWDQEYVSNWSMTERSPCYVFKARDTNGIMQVLEAARTRGVSVIPYGAGHSYTDAALNTNGVLLEVTGMSRILSWDPEQGIMQVEPGVRMRELARTALADRWWPAVTPSTPDATVGGCVAMNVHGKNAWKCGSFGEHVLSLTVLMATGQALTLSSENNPPLFKALVGSAGLLGIITSITLQLQRIPSGNVETRTRPASTLSEIFTIFHEEQAADYLEAWVDGLATGRHLGRGIVTSAKHSGTFAGDSLQSPESGLFDVLMAGFARRAGTICRPALKSGTRIANSARYWWASRSAREVIRQRPLFQYTFYPPAAFAGYRALLPEGTETFQAFIPYKQAETLFEEILRRSQGDDFMPLWCVIKRHRRDPFLLSYQVDGFSFELNYQVAPKTFPRLHQLLRELMDLVIGAGGRFYLAKDSLLTAGVYRQSVGVAAVEEFLQLKHLYDPEMLFQSNLFHRVFEVSMRGQMAQAVTLAEVR